MATLPGRLIHTLLYVMTIHTYIHTYKPGTHIAADGGLNVLYCIVISYQSHIVILQHYHPVIPVAAKGLLSLSLPVTRATDSTLLIVPY